MVLGYDSDSMDSRCKRILVTYLGNLKTELIIPTLRQRLAIEQGPSQDNFSFFVVQGELPTSFESRG